MKNFVKNLLDARGLSVRRMLRLRAATIAMNCVLHDNLVRLTHGSQLVIKKLSLSKVYTPQCVTRSPPKGIVKLSEVFMNNWLFEPQLHNQN